MPAGRGAEAQNLRYGRLFVGADVHVETRFVGKGFSGYIHQRIDLYPNIRIYGIDGRLEFEGTHTAFAQKAKRLDRIAAGSARQGQPLLKQGSSVCIR